MSILWCGGEDIDFPFGNFPFNTTVGAFRQGYARCALGVWNTATGRWDGYSKPFPGGAVQTAWLSFQLVQSSGGIAYTVNSPMIGLANSANPRAGIFLGTGTANARAAILSYDGTTATNLAETALYALTTNGKWDMLVSNFGSNTTITVFLNGLSILSWTGNLTGLGFAGLDTVHVYDGAHYQYSCANLSEIIVADEDTRTMALATLAPTAAGTTDQWSGAAISGTTLGALTISDANPVYSNTAGQDEQATLTTPTAGTWGVKAVKIAARAAASTDASISKLQLGIKQAGVVSVGTAHSLLNSYTTVEDIETTNPATGAAWQYGDLSAMQLDMRTSA